MCCTPCNSTSRRTMRNTPPWPAFRRLTLRRVPRRTDSVDWGGYKFEVIDVDSYRIDQVLVTRLAADGTAIAPSAETRCRCRIITKTIAVSALFISPNALKQHYPSPLPRQWRPGRFARAAIAPGPAPGQSPPRPQSDAPGPARRRGG